MPAPLTDRRREQLRREVAEAALRLAAEHPWTTVTVAQVAAEAGISRRAFFTHFPSKDDALLVGASDDLRVLERALAGRTEGQTFVDVLAASADGWVDEMGDLSATRRVRWEVERTVPEVAGKVSTTRAAALSAIARPHVARDLGVTPDHPVARMVADAFAGIGHALDRLCAAEPDQARLHVQRSLPLLQALVDAAAVELGARA
ncbi:TetR/AcrR family transcriptional regulator [Nocardioides litoris]|uniref:TetR/AcrR family transcriptional regulator n=1 Tax=Nocardioides litoris TaxID=1926648 RepID=UPI0014768602|nr:TetR/AcrR family transcriptional regulator [Nocardioides litoris]